MDISKREVMQRRSVISALYKDIPVRSLLFCLLPWNRLDVLMSPQHGDVLPLKIVTYTTVSVSLFLLLLTFILLCLLRRLRSNLHAIHRNLVAALFFSELVFLLGINQTDNPVSPTLSSGDYNIFFSMVCNTFCQMNPTIPNVLLSIDSNYSYIFLQLSGLLRWFCQVSICTSTTWSSKSWTIQQFIHHFD